MINNNNNNNNSKTNLKNLCYYCFNILISHLQNKNHTIKFPENFKNDSSPIFITYRTLLGGETQGALRGCRGTLHPALLEKNLQKFSLSAALDDNRFPPITLEEIPFFNLEISAYTKLINNTLAGCIFGIITNHNF